MEYYDVSLHGLFFFFMNFFLRFFFQNGLCRFFFILSWLRIVLRSFFFKTLWIVIMFPHMVFVLLQCFPICFFFKLSLSYYFFNIDLVENLALTFSTCFFSIFFRKIVFIFFIFLCFFFQNRFC